MSILESFKLIKTFIFDVDGVLTDGRIFIFDNGEHARSMSIKDGYVLQLAIKKGYRVMIISGAVSEAVKVRLHKLGITEVFQGITNKEEVVKEYVTKHQLSLKEVLFMGDDIPDYAVMKLVGLSSAPADAAPEIKHIARYISPFKGGEGCVRDVLEKVLKLNDHWELDVTVASK